MIQIGGTLCYCCCAAGTLALPVSFLVLEKTRPNVSSAPLLSAHSLVCLLLRFTLPTLAVSLFWRPSTNVLLVWLAIHCECVAASSPCLHLLPPPDPPHPTHTLRRACLPAWRSHGAGRAAVRCEGALAPGHVPASPGRGEAAPCLQVFRVLGNAGHHMVVLLWRLGFGARWVGILGGGRWEQQDGIPCCRLAFSLLRAVLIRPTAGCCCCRHAGPLCQGPLRLCRASGSGPSCLEGRTRAPVPSGLPAAEHAALPAPGGVSRASLMGGIGVPAPGGHRLLAASGRVAHPAAGVCRVRCEQALGEAPAVGPLGASAAVCWSTPTHLQPVCCAAPAVQAAMLTCWSWPPELAPVPCWRDRACIQMQGSCMQLTVALASACPCPWPSASQLAACRLAMGRVSVRLGRIRRLGN